LHKMSLIKGITMPLVVSMSQLGNCCTDLEYFSIFGNSHPDSVKMFFSIYRPILRELSQRIYWLRNIHERPRVFFSQLTRWVISLAMPLSPFHIGWRQTKMLTA
jgi:hypothetical protein